LATAPAARIPAAVSGNLRLIATGAVIASNPRDAPRPPREWLT